VTGNRSRGVTCLIDTDIVIDFLRRREYALELLKHWSNNGLIAVSTLTHLEIYQGMKINEEAVTNSFLDDMISIAVDVQIARQAGVMMRNLRSKGKTMSIGDAIIAATALDINVPLLTNNTQHYIYQGLKVIRGLDFIM